MIYRKAVAPRVVVSVLFGAVVVVAWVFFLRPAFFGRSVPAISNAIANVLWSFHIDAATIEIALGIAVGSVWLLSILSDFVAAWMTRLVVDERGVVLQEGIIFYRKTTCSRRAISSVNYSQGLIGALFGFGDLEIHTTGSEALLIPGIKGAGQAAAEISDLIGAAS